jgi:hypothetical protein
MKGVDAAVRNQSVTADDMNKMPTVANARAEMQRANRTVGPQEPGGIIPSMTSGVEPGTDCPKNAGA